jgi:radical SAM protein with 4Fe4S-binding SPASM domain
LSGLQRPRASTDQGSRRFLSTIAPPLFGIGDAGDGPPVLFRQRIRLLEGEVGIFIDVQTVSSPTVPNVEVAIVGAMGKLPVNPVPNGHGSHIATFRCRVDADMEAEFVLKGELPSDSLIRRIEIGPASEMRSWVVPHRGPTSIEPPSDQIRNLIIGTTGVCNASCVHCPTNKLLPSARWTSDMPMELFDSLVDQILENEIFITGYISLGLFGDGLVDRRVIQRAARLHSAFPYASLHVNTNGAAYNHSRHAPLGSLVDTLAIHIETLEEAKYARIMEPLKLPNVLPKIHQIITDMPEVATIASPVHRDNIHELPLIREYFANRGVRSTIFTGMSNRCSRDEIFQELAVAPSSGSCAAEIISDLIVDWDGLVLVCCNDFLRRQPIGNLKEETLLEILHCSKRRLAFDALRDGAWEDIDTCRTCKFSAPAI